VRLAGKTPEIFFRMRRIGNGSEFFLELAFHGDPRRRESGNAAGILRAAGNCGG